MKKRERYYTNFGKKNFSKTKVYLLILQIERSENLIKISKYVLEGICLWEKFTSVKKDTTQNIFKLSIVEIFRTNLFYYLINSLNPGFIIHKIV